MKELLEEFHEYIKFWYKKSPEQVRKFMEFMEVVEKKGALDTKTKELIAVAVAVAAQCQWCIAFHVNEALKAGATPEEIREAGWVAVLMGGGPQLAYMQLLEKALEEFSK
ncbi:carboxymuconolactone decarboxylase family protein [Desulfurococcaceae archaeon MEX13E-LK6-19]|nr:carboxymuconolactone decarboxylase family protein [Desulfurococcaceae archaeon MEX13E-LK6-19]